ncbi:hypothetical protein GCM10028832_03360 [Streptomyces sparsus]
MVSVRARLAEVILPFAARAWTDLQDPEPGAVRFEHDHYLKMRALTALRIEADFLLLDEAQDINPVLEHVFAAQRHHAQLYGSAVSPGRGLWITLRRAISRRRADSGDAAHASSRADRPVLGRTGRGWAPGQ